jgi:hypothetical protein
LKGCKKIFAIDAKEISPRRQQNNKDVINEICDEFGRPSLKKYALAKLREKQ